MSDDFDREAERRKLEEKFGEEEDREQTERLSELLLKGATMTDIHCPECGDPVFRHEGRQFCPSCQREVAGGQGQQATAGQAAARDPLADDGSEPEPATDGHSVEVETPGDAGDGATDGPAPDEGERPDATADTAGDADAATSAQSGQGAPRQPSEGQTAPATPQGGAGATDPAVQAPTTPQAGGTASGLLPARQHLTRTVNRLAEQATAEEDPGRKREFLAATREAAEALAAVRDAE